MSTVQPGRTAASSQPATQGDKVVRLELDAQGIATLRLGAADEAVVTLTKARLDSLEQALQQLAAEPKLRGVVITGPGPGMFCAGADIGLIQDVATSAEGRAAAERGRTVFARCRQLKVPVVAAIEGPCLGGGCELALFCDVRVASDHGSTQIGLPEVKLGILPGFGGTQNLARLLGLPKALDLILNGKLLRGKAARKQGLIDRLVPSEKLLRAAREEIERLVTARRKAPPRRLRGAAFWLSRTPLRALAVRAAGKALAQGQARFYPAPRLALQCCVQAFTDSHDRGFAAEAQALGELIVTPVSKGLVHLFFLTERSKRLGKHEHARDLQRALVVGGGVMGAGIAGQLAEKGLRTRLCDVDLAPLQKAKARLQQELDKRLRRGHLERHDAQAIQDRLAVATDWGSLHDTDLWLEAVVEDLGVKQKLMAQAIARGLPDTAILATNTSSLSVTAMAQALPNPARVVGIHFFNPPEKMPLVEVIRGRDTSDAAVATACRLAVRLGKFPVVTADAPGFLVNRCLSPYLNEAARLLLEGTSAEAIDAAMLDFGMPMGPCRLLDEVGFDVAAKVSAVMQAAFPQRMVPCDLFAAMAKERHLGQKTGGGIYGKDGTGPGPGRAVVERLRQQRGTPARPASRAELVQRLVYPLVDEAYRCLDDGIVQDERDLDLGLVMGIGFPPFTGGITRWAQREGLSTILMALDTLARSGAERFSPSDGLRRRAST
ncbi:MAG: 3-hydroxyacyl-CoA dehydrogenase NAD-binding domain-containing protein [Planctomycetes bacterium]|jgi:3-hydroxyacyl-CoA dehydrogenase/enoyl-CoA hydratase/3-hydroxybutyryl-CoA epimerase|nr:3-hydroxyacyl-CoA dehydrogenase NAD-binding domain-containing protein [Planctomycetota bacterium]